jgi:competence ComEA-like helix-hairpin-helix protein
MRGFFIILTLLLSGSLLAHPGPQHPPAGQSRSVSGLEGRVDLNKATLQELCTLPGIGPKRAKAIIDQREKRPFSRITQLLKIKGIGHRTLKRLKGRITVHGPEAKKGPAK